MKNDRSTKTVLFLCSGNYYRSRFAEHYFNWHAENEGRRWRAKSKGLAVGRSGNIGPISRHAIERLKTLGIPLDGDSRFPQAVGAEHLSDAALIIGLKEAEHRAMFEESFPSWTDRVEYWNIDDLDCAGPEEALPNLERKVRELLEQLGKRSEDV
jgi:protein-tyrosine phosphatase